MIEDIEKKIAAEYKKIEAIPAVKQHRKVIRKLEKEIDKYKKQCKHENCLALYESNTGNYDPDADIYWVNIKCLSCKKTFRYYSNQEGYRGNYKNVDKYNKKEVADFWENYYKD